MKSIFLAHLEHDALEPCICLVKSLLQRIVKMDVQLFVVGQVAANGRHQPVSVELFCSDRVEVRGKDVDSLSHGLRGPLFRSGER